MTFVTCFNLGFAAECDLDKEACRQTYSVNVCIISHMVRLRATTLLSFSRRVSSSVRPALKSETATGNTKNNISMPRMLRLRLSDWTYFE